MENRHDINTFWESICKIHTLTKHYSILAEEISHDYKTFIQPMKELRDAYEHVVRAYTSNFNPRVNSSNKDDYINTNLTKALGHEYRAFFDTADWFALICRENINRSVQMYIKSNSDIKEKVPNYDEMKNRIYEINNEIAQLRENKDVGNNSILIEEVDSYRRILDELYEFQHQIEKVLI